jgi:hypothetical protein
MADFIEKDVFVGFDNSDILIIQVLGDPFGFDQHFGMGVGGHSRLSFPEEAGEHGGRGQECFFSLAPVRRRYRCPGLRADL